MNPARVRRPVALGVALALCLVSAAGAEPEATSTHLGKIQPDRVISLEMLVEGTPEEIFEDWASSDGILRFFGSGSRIEPHEGGLYEIQFGQRPDGEIAGPRDNRILRYEPPHALDFEWEMPFFARQLNTRPLPTWVEVRFDGFGEDGRRTRIRLNHHGFGPGEEWDQSFSFFQRGWFDILFRLRLHRAYFDR